MVEKQTIASVLHNRGFLNLWINQVLVQLSFNALNFALIVWVFRLTDSNIAVSALLFTFYLPAVLLGLFSGILIDIVDRRKIIMIINLLLCISFFSLIYLKTNYPAILAITFFINALGHFYGTAEASAIPIIVKRNQLIIANSIFSTTLYSCFLLGFGVSGPLISLLGIDFVFKAGGSLLILAFLLSLVFPAIIGAIDEKSRKLIQAIRKWNLRGIIEVGGGEVNQTLMLIRGKLPILTSILILAGVQMVVGIIAVLVPSFLEKTLQINATDASYILIIPLGLGIVTGGIILGKLGQKLIKRKLVSKAIILSGLLFFLVGAAPIVSPAIKYLPRSKPLSFVYQPPLSKILMFGSFLMGAALVSILVPSQTVLQQNTSEAIRGKVFSVLGAVMSGLSLIPVLLTGVLADIFGTTPIFIGLGATIILFGLFGLNPSLFLKKEQLSFRVREFLGLGHWEK